MRPHETERAPKNRQIPAAEIALNHAFINTNATAVYTPPKRKLEQVKGLEPATFSLGSCNVLSLTTCDKNNYDFQKFVLGRGLAILCEKRPDLAEVLEAWDHLPEVIRLAIRAMIESVRKGEGGM